MKQQVRAWGVRILTLAIIAIVVQQWGLPLYKRYVTPKKIEAFVPTTKAKVGRFIVSFHQTGTLRAAKSVPVATEDGGKIISLVADGKFVKAGELLVEMDTTEQESRVNEHELSYRNALADVDRVKAEQVLLVESNKTDMEKTEAQFAFDKAELERSTAEFDKYTRLAAEKLVPGTKVEAQEIDVRAKALKVLLSTKDQALKKKEIESKEQQKKSDVRNKEYSAKMALSNLEHRKRDMAQSKIVAPTSGMVVLASNWNSGERRKWQAGDTPYSRSTICELPDLSRMQVKTQVGEADSPKLRIGLPVTVKLEAVKNKQFSGNVSDISRLVSESNPWDSNSTPGRRSFEVTIDLKQANPSLLRPGMTADAEFICGSVPKAVSVPIEAIFERRGETFVFVKKEKRYVLTLVKTGVSNDNSIIITKGLKGGEVVALRDPKAPTEELNSQESTEKKKAELPSLESKAGKR